MLEREAGNRLEVGGQQEGDEGDEGERLVGFEQGQARGRAGGNVEGISMKEVRGSDYDLLGTGGSNYNTNTNANVQQ